MEVSEAIELAKAGNEKAFTFLYNRFYNSIYRIIYNIVKNKDVADDLISETFLKAFKNIHKFTRDISFEMWLKTIANNHSIDFIRSGMKSKNDVYVDDDQMSEFIYTDWSNPEKSMIEKENYEAYERALSNLSHKSGEVLTLRYKHNLSYQEIATKLGISIGTVKHYIHRFTKILVSNINQSSKRKDEKKKSILISGNQVLS